jgi:hypothetical protein
VRRDGNGLRVRVSWGMDEDGAKREVVKSVVSE